MSSIHTDPQISEAVEAAEAEDKQDSQIMYLAIACLVTLVVTVILLAVNQADFNARANNIKALGQTGVTTIQALTPPIFAQIKQSVSALQATAETNLELILNTISNGVRRVTNIVATVGGGLIQAIRDGFGALLYTLQQLGTQIAQFFSTLIVPVSLALESAADSIMAILQFLVYGSGFSVLVKLITNIVEAL
jgi:hypothetical protein